MSIPLTRIAGVLTAAYSLALVAKPAVLLGPCKLTESDDNRGLARGIGARDLATGIAMAFAPAGAARRTVVAARVASDVGDATLLAAALRGRGTAGEVTAAGLLWGTLCAAAALYDESRG